MAVALRSFASSVTRVFSCSKCEKTPTNNFVYGLLWLSFITRLDKKAQVLRCTIWDPPSQADWQFSSSFDGHVPLSADVVSPPTLMGPKLESLVEPLGSHINPSAQAACMSELLAYKCFTNKGKGEEGRGRGEGKKKPQTVASPAAPTIQTANQPDLTYSVCFCCGLTLLNRRVSHVDGVLSQWSSGVQQQSTWLLGTVLASSPASPSLVVPAWLLLEHDLSFWFFLQVPEENINGVVNALQVSQAEKH